MNPLIGVLLLALHSGPAVSAPAFAARAIAAPATLKRSPKVDDRATYAMQAIIDLGAHLTSIVVHDHVIIGREGHVSFRAKGLI